VVREPVYNDELTAAQWALNSAVECHLHTVEVIGSNPIAPTIATTPFCSIGKAPTCSQVVKSFHFSTAR
jgi:hypothetical protein